MIDVLIQQGLTRKEAEIYLILIRYGSQRASSVCQLTKINRTLVYALLDGLVQKGFVERVSQNGKKYYIAHNPQAFLQKAKAQLNGAKLLIENLRNIQLTKSQPVVRTFQGLDGILEMTDIFLDEAQAAGGYMLQMGQEIQFVLEYPELIEDFITKRTSRGIPLRLLCNEFEGFERYLNDDRDGPEERNVKFVPYEDLDVDCTTYIYGDSMAVLSLADEMQGYILKSKNITDLNRKIFYILWNKL